MMMARALLAHWFQFTSDSLSSSRVLLIAFMTCRVDTSRDEAEDEWRMERSEERIVVGDSRVARAN